jgi:sodium/bile acid cotransporter 7
MSQLWKQFWFLLALGGILSSGIAAGYFAPTAFVDTYLTVVRPNITTAVVLFLMAYSLDSSQLRESLRRPGAAVWGSVVNLGLLPLVAAVAARGLTPPDFSLGLIITSVAPCTLATASVFTRRAGGNDAISLLVTLLTNSACVVVTPLWLQALVSRTTELELSAIVRQLVLCVLLPTLLGQLALIPRASRAWARRVHRKMSLASQLIVLLIVSVAAMKGGWELRRQAAWPPLSDFGSMAAMCLVVHVVGLAGGWYGGEWLRLSPEDRIATAIAGSQKTLPVGLLIATNPSVVSAAVPFVTFPLLVFHAIQLVLDTALADAWRVRRGVTD